MKKVLSLLLAAGVCTMLLASCGNGDTNETTTAETTIVETTTLETTTGSELETTTNTTTEATTPEETTTNNAATEDTAIEETTTTTNVSLVEGVINSAEHDYIVKLVENADTHEIIGVAVCYWKTDKTATDVVFDEVFIYTNEMGEECSYPVVQIGYGQGIVPFQADTVETITVPSSVKKIYDNAFSGYPNMKTVALSEGLEEIGSMAFWYNPSLEEVVIPSTVKTIGNYAFADCVNLKKVTLPRSFESRIDMYFANCPNAEFVFID